LHMGSLDRSRERSDVSHRRSRISNGLREFLETEVSGGVFLLVGAVAALVWAATSASSYGSIWTGHLPAAARLGLPETLRTLINDGLMTIFFFVVGLETKRELVSGELKDRRAAALPAIAALGGMVAPAVIYLWMTRGGAAQGWGIPMATDIAFALGVLTLFGRGLPQGLRVLLLTLAIADDIGTLIVITFFYAATPRWTFLILAVLLLVTVGFSVSRSKGRVSLFVVFGVALWWLTLKSGVPPTIAGVAVGLLIPSGGAVVQRVENLLHPWTSFVIVPLFALANAGVPLAPGRFGVVAGSEVARAVLVARVGGKLLGIVLGAWIAVRLGVGVLPTDVGWRHVVALGCVASVGFTIPLFVTTLAFHSSGLVDDAKLGILLTTAFGFVIGGVALRIASRGASTIRS
jgi:NhaA family Na+:H+ antiporter